MNTAPLPRKGRAWPWIIAALGLVGAGVSLLSTMDHVGFRNPTGRDPGFCSAIVESGCASAHSSSVSEILGIPISHLGTVFYVAVVLAAVFLGVVGLRKRDSTNRWVVGGPVALLIPALGSLPYSAYLGSVMYASGEACPFCLALYGVNIGLAATSAVWAWPMLRIPAAAIRAAIPSLVALGMVMGILLAGTAPIVLAQMRTVAESKETAEWKAAGNLNLAHPVPAHVPHKGSPGAETMVVEVSDFDCPYCARMHRTVGDVARRLGTDRVFVRFVNYPLDPSCNPHLARAVHPDACRVALAAICAEQAGRFWEFAELAFAGRGHRKPQDLQDLARSSGMDVEAFNTCMQAPQTARTLSQDIAWAHEAGVSATPTTLVNGVRFEGAMDEVRLEQAVVGILPCGCERRTADVACGARVFGTLNQEK